MLPIRIALGALIASSLSSAEPTATPPNGDAVAPPAVAPMRTATLNSDGIHSGDVIGGAAEPSTVTPSRTATFGMSGLHFGGIIGASAEATLTVMPDWPVIPEASAAIGISGTKFGLGARWPLGERHWVLGKDTGPIAIETTTSLTPRLIACYRWEDHEREPDFWRGIVSDDGWYLGGEMGVTWNGLDLDIAVTWHEGDGPRTTLAYGFAF
jgi:hypothetical protein